MEAYLGMCIPRDFKGNNKSVCEWRNSVSERPIFDNKMALSRFEDIGRMLRFDYPSNKNSKTLE